MKMPSCISRFLLSLVAAAVLVVEAIVQAQGTITFDGAALFSGLAYTESGMMFQVVLPQGGTPDYMAVMRGITGPSNVPYNPTPYMIWLRQFNSYDHVSLSVNSGSTFGLTSVQLADANSPSLSPVPILFVGYMAGGSTVTNTFTTPGNGADHLLDYQFTPGFADGLVSVDIFAPKWAMDNLAFTIPEPSAGALVLAVVACGFGRARATRRRDKKM